MKRGRKVARGCLPVSVSPDSSSAWMNVVIASSRPSFVLPDSATLSRVTFAAECTPQPGLTASETTGAGEPPAVAVAVEEVLVRAATSATSSAASGCKLGPLTVTSLGPAPSL